MSSSQGPSPCGSAMKGSGLLLTHDWAQLQTEHGLVDTTETLKVEDPGYQTIIFPLSSASQYEACISGQMVCGEQNVLSCPLEIDPSSGSCSPGSCSSGSCTSGSNSSCLLRPLSAVVKVTYKVTHVVLGSKNRNLCKAAMFELQEMMEKLLEEKDEMEGSISSFLHKFGSHFQCGAQRLGKAFMWMVLVDEACDMKLLTEIAEEIFEICDRHERHFPGTREGSWYSSKQFFNTLMFSEEKKQLLEDAKLRMSHSGVQAKSMSLQEWKNTNENQPENLDGIDNTSIVSAWDLIKLQFENSEELSSAIKEGWNRLKNTSSHKDPDVPHNPQVINIPWCRLVEELGMEQYYPCKLLLREARCIRKMPERCEKKEELVWRVLSQLMFTDPQCREQEVNKYAIVAQQGHLPKKLSNFRKKSGVKDENIPTVLHPMDVLLLLFTCCDFMLRQVLARKLFLCRLAIPFIVPMPTLDTVEMLIWPLRSIIMEWIDKEEALVDCKLNMVTFIRCGKTSFSKSKLLNELLSPSGHPVFFHQGLPGGNHKRLISNGTVEMSHFLPGGSQDDQFIEPALFFNLRGDACDHSVQHTVLMGLPTTVVILVDIGELSKQQVQQKLKSTLASKMKDVIVVLTNSRNLDKENIELQMDSFIELVGDEIDIDEDVVLTFEMEESGDKNISTVMLETKDAIARKMATGHRESIESLKMSAMPQVLIDEIENRHCQEASDVAEDLLTSVKQLDACERKEKLLPLQGECLLETGKLLRQLHRNSSKDASLSNKEEIIQCMKAIRNVQAMLLNNDLFVMKVISLFCCEAETIKFAIRLVQQKLDILSRAILPKLQAEKNSKWKALSEARNQHDNDRVVVLEQEVHQAEKKVADASCGWEHLMREVGQLYEVSMELKMVDRPGSAFPLPTLPEIVGRQLLDGHPVELMDGDHGVIPIEWVKAVFRSLAELAGLNKKIFVLSVMGIQSSGKSTLLNTMFGLEFAVSAGRCTRGIYAQLLPVADREDLPFDYILVLDSEGLKSQEQENQNFEHDNELATLVIGLADLALINLKGENPREITDVLQIVVYAFLRMKLADSPHKRQCMFIHQNVSAINAKHKLAGDRQRLLEELDRMTQEASIAQGFSSETISAFNQIISFDCHRDVVYFSDLWNGNPPMANVNHEYSKRAAHTRQNLMEDISQNFKGFITVTDFISRLEDIWNGVLTDDFIFSFRNTLAAKAYLEVERECARHTLQVEEQLMQWINTDCKSQMENTKSEDQLHQKHGELKKHLNVKLSALIAEKIEMLENFFEKHHASEIIMQWKSEKHSSVQLYCENLGRQREADLENMKIRTVFQIRQCSEAQNHEQEIIRKAITVAETMRGKCPSDGKLEEQFDTLWQKWSACLVTTPSKTPSNALEVLDTILWEKMRSEGNTKYFQDVERGPVAAEKTIPEGGIVKDHILLKEIPFSWRTIWEKMVHSRSKYLDEALKKANDILSGVGEEVHTICSQDIMFNPLHGRQIVDYLFQEISKHNALPFGKTKYTFTPEFKAMMAIRVAYLTAPMFDRMSQQFEENHGVHAQVQAYRQRVFLLFKNTVKNTSAEMTAAEDFREMIKGKIIEYVKIELEQTVQSELYRTIGNTKYDLITKMLDEIVQRKNTDDTQMEMNFKALITYVTHPLRYATGWMKTFCDDLLFGRDKGQSKYSELADHISRKIISKIVSSTTSATDKVAGLEDKERYSAWITAFCDNMNDTLPLDHDQLRLTTSIACFGNFQKFLEDGLKVLETDVKAAFSHVNVQSVEWLGTESPHQKAVKFLWGCTELCPFCSEPCQCSDPNHRGSHRCVQHKPNGIRSIWNCNSKELVMTTCTVNITSGATFSCGVCSKQCRSTVHCNRTDADEDDPIHLYREYKKFLPDWDIAPDPADNASKYWQWAICTFQKQIRQWYKGSKLEIPQSWKYTTAQQAIDSLRVYR